MAGRLSSATLGRPDEAAVAEGRMGHREGRVQEEASWGRQVGGARGDGRASCPPTVKPVKHRREMYTPSLRASPSSYLLFCTYFK